MTLEEILARLENLADLSEDEIAEIDAALEAQIDEITEQDTTPETVAALNQIGDARDAITAELEARETARAELEAEAAAALARVRPPEPDAEAEPEAETTDPPATADAEADPPAAEVEPEPEAVAASASRRSAARGAPLAAIARNQPRSTRERPESNAPTLPTLTAAPDTRSFTAGQSMSWDDAAVAMVEMLELSRGAHAGAPIRRRVGSLDWRNQYPDDRTLVAGADVEENTRKIFELTHGEDGNLMALTATGGLCAPLEVRYDVVDNAVADRPLRAGLPAFRADRGGLRWMPSPTLADVIVDNTGGAIDTMVPADDLTGGGTGTKTVQEFTCPTEQSAQIYAISERLRFGNFADRYWPENMRAQMSVARASHSRRAERGLMEAMRTASLQVNGGVLEVGAFRTFVALIRAAARHYRYQYRISEDANLRIVLPTWLPDVLFVDLLWQAPGDGLINGVVDAVAQLTRHLADFNVSIIWQRDDARTNNVNGAGAPAFTAQTAGALTDYPGRVETILFHEGNFVFLDGGQLDFGIIRDSALNAINRFETFFEVFENVASVGLGAWDITIQLCANGATGAPSTSVGCGPVGS